MPKAGFPVVSSFCVFFCSDPHHTSAWVGWPHVQAPVTGGTAFPAAGDSACWNPILRPMGGLLPTPPRLPTPPHPPPSPVPGGICLCNYGLGQHRTFSLLLKLAHEKQQEIEITVHLTLIISLEMKINIELVTCSENSKRTWAHTLKELLGSNSPVLRPRRPAALVAKWFPVIKSSSLGKFKAGPGDTPQRRPEFQGSWVSSGATVSPRTVGPPQRDSGAWVWLPLCSQLLCEKLL